MDPLVSVCWVCVGSEIHYSVPDSLCFAKEYTPLTYILRRFFEPLGFLQERANGFTCLRVQISTGGYLHLKRKGVSATYHHLR